MRPEIVIHAGAYTDVDGATCPRLLAMAVNADGTERKSPARRRRPARLIWHGSTDYV